MSIQILPDGTLKDDPKLPLRHAIVSSHALPRYIGRIRREGENHAGWYAYGFSSYEFAAQALQTLRQMGEAPA